MYYNYYYLNQFMRFLVCIAYEQKPPFSAHAFVSSKARDLNFGLSLHLNQNFVYASSNGSGESVHMRRLA